MTRRSDHSCPHTSRRSQLVSSSSSSSTTTHHLALPLPSCPSCPCSHTHRAPGRPSCAAGVETEAPTQVDVGPAGAHAEQPCAQRGSDECTQAICGGCASRHNRCECVPACCWSAASPAWLSWPSNPVASSWQQPRQPAVAGGEGGPSCSHSRMGEGDGTQLQPQLQGRGGASSCSHSRAQPSPH